MDSDSELLELAAKAAGFEVIRIADDGNAFMLYGVQEPWNPLQNALDALELACNLYMTVKIDDAGFTLVYAGNWQRDIFIDAVVELHKDTTPLMATCRAIVRAAAEIGKAMP